MAAAGREPLSFSEVAGAKRAISNPALTAASVAMTPGPPAFVTMLRRLPAGMG